MSTTKLFEIGLALKGLDALLELAGGVFLLIPTAVNKTIITLAQHELFAEPHHRTTAHLEHAAVGMLQKANWLGAIYLVVHGLAKLTLITAIFKKKRWGYVGLIVVLSVFTLLEVGKGIVGREAFPIVFGFFDALIVFLIAKEYRDRYGKKAPSNAKEAT